MIKCPNCEHENVPGTQFCEGCGEELTQDSSAGATTATSSQAMIKCPACDNMNPADNVACEVCGAELSGASGASSVSSTSVPSVDAATAAMPDAAIPTGDNSGAVPIAPIPADLADPTAGALSANTSPSDTPPMPAAPIPDMSLPTAPVAPVPPTPPTPPVAPAPLPAGDLAPGKVKLVVEQGQTVGAQFVLGDAEMLVGREDTDEAIYPDIDLSDQDAGYVHRKHATLRFDNGNLSVEHLGGSNKTRINNKPIPDNEPQPLKLGDKVSFGKVVMRLLPV
jgi:ribosomal protein S27E